MLRMKSGSGDTWIAVALPPSPWSRQTKPGEESASALIRSSASKKGWTAGSPGGATRVPTLICARCQSPLMPNRPSDMLHVVGNVVEGRVAVDLVLGGIEHRRVVAGIGCGDRGRGYHPEAHA